MKPQFKQTVQRPAVEGCGQARSPKTVRAAHCCTDRACADSGLPARPGGCGERGEPRRVSPAASARDGPAGKAPADRAAPSAAYGRGRRSRSGRSHRPRASAHPSGRGATPSAGRRRRKGSAPEQAAPPTDPLRCPARRLPPGLLLLGAERTQHLGADCRVLEPGVGLLGDRCRCVSEQPETTSSRAPRLRG